MGDWHDDDEWWRATQAHIFGPEAWERAPREVEQVVALARLAAPLRVLDMPCGVGRHALELARRGCTVTAVDRTAAYLEQARARAREQGVQVEFVQEDMRTFVRPASFDLALNLFTSFGYFENQDDDRRVLANFFSSLRPGGALVMEMAGREVLARIFQPRDWRELPDGTLLLEERRLAREWTWMENRWILIRGTERRELPLRHRLYGGADLRSRLEEAGFAPVTVHGDLAGAPYDHGATRLVAVGRKPA
jgi:SAM-dependent methyltransferase